ncbi:MAG: tyrosine-type recombinase/integrase [Nitrososphaerota archaeon]|jgi:integrase|nr:tyrosine-type recombinase/integrase [Nitrososphaerota archaeon]MDG6928245.1 tyrosine-type recombinase/integrase [Nitrososphaerota archaeon]MDG6930739.1 tyrosine-type recombinase/integrase [Nitrososphaerota archaeon]MDG6931825.1 tyrosine-type recombinase/integrase [Nitrososphaerota archaeon]MDG6935451.1 tyrosine-type recombinase/integrase [Nitrososphaerota archaeon]
MGSYSRPKALAWIEKRINEYNEVHNVDKELAKKNWTKIYTYLTSVGDRTGNSTKVLGTCYANYLWPYLCEHGKAIEEMDRQAVNDMVQERLAGHKGSTIVDYLGKILQLINWYRGMAELGEIKMKYIAIPRRPDEPVGSLHKTNKVKDRLTDEDIAKIMSQIKNPELKLYVFLMDKLGLRLKEANGITWNDIKGNPNSPEPEKPSIHIVFRDGIRGAKGPKGERIIKLKELVEYKTPKGETVSVMSRDDLLYLYDQLRTLFRLKNITKDTMNTWIIHHSDRAMSKAFKIACINAGLKPGRGGGITPHSLRHHFVIRAIHNNAPVDILSNWTGDTPETLMRYYYESE